MNDNHLTKGVIAVANTTTTSSDHRGLMKRLLAVFFAAALVLVAPTTASATTTDFAGNGYVGTATQADGTIAVELTSVPEGVGGVAVYLKETADTPGYVDSFPISTPGDGPWSGSIADPGGIGALFVYAGADDPGVYVDLYAAPPDDDADGVPNDLDKCTGTPVGELVDANGCSSTQLDPDGDGVLGADDLCPDQAGPAANNGCPLPPPDEPGVPGNGNGNAPSHAGQRGKPAHAGEPGPPPHARGGGNRR